MRSGSDVLPGVQCAARLVAHGFRGPAIEAFWRVIRNEAIQLRLDLRNTGQLDVGGQYFALPRQGQGAVEGRPATHRARGHVAGRELIAFHFAYFLAARAVDGGVIPLILMYGTTVP